MKGLKFHNLLLKVFTRALRVSKYPLPLTLEYSLSEAVRRTDVIFSRSSIQASEGMRKASEYVKKMMPLWKAMSEAVWGQNY